MTMVESGVTSDIGTRSWPEMTAGEPTAVSREPGSEAVWVPSVDLPLGAVEPPITGSPMAVLKTLAPYLVIAVAYLGIAVACWGGTGILDWGGTDPSQNNVTYGWEYFSIPLIAVLTVGLNALAIAAVTLPVALLGSAWKRFTAKRHPVQEVPTDAPVSAPPPRSFTTKARLRTAGHRWVTREGNLALDDDGLSFQPTKGRRGPTSAISWAQITHLRLHPRISWGRFQRGHLTVDLADGRHVDWMIPRTGYHGLARLLGSRPMMITS